VVTRETKIYVKNRANLIYAKLRSIICIFKATEYVYLWTAVVQHWLMFQS